MSPASHPPSSRALKRERQHVLREIVSSRAVSSQHELVDLLAGRGFDVTQATVSRDITEMGLVKVADDGRHVYAWPGDLGSLPPTDSDERLRRVLADYPIHIGRSGLTLLLISEAGVANAIGQAIDESSLHEQEGTLAGDNTLLVLFADEVRLRTWLDRFDALRASAVTNKERR
ncbi:MAG: arginine repressor [Chloroflexota bacterium]|jgi:transcriptional regulator of arginine metabolism